MLSNNIVKFDDPRIISDLRYSSSSNIAGIPISDIKKVQVADSMVKLLRKVLEELELCNLKLVFWDAYRLEATQKKLRKINSNNNFVAEISNHCKGLAVDVTLANKDNKYLDMGTDFDDFSIKARSDYEGLSKKQMKNRRELKKVMEINGFSQDVYEWWHFNFIAI